MILSEVTAQDLGFPDTVELHRRSVICQMKGCEVKLEFYAASSPRWPLAACITEDGFLGIASDWFPEIIEIYAGMGIILLAKIGTVPCTHGGNHQYWTWRFIHDNKDEVSASLDD
jgi:hypothetical protein